MPTKKIYYTKHALAKMCGVDYRDVIHWYNKNWLVPAYATRGGLPMFTIEAFHEAKKLSLQGLMVNTQPAVEEPKKKKERKVPKINYAALKREVKTLLKEKQVANL